MSGEPRQHSPQDHIYGPLNIPGYCWAIIDTPEYQRLRHISQLGAVSLVYPGANHSRFEHSLGCCHLAVTFIERIQRNQPEIQIEPDQTQSVVLAALCHDLGRGPFNEAFDRFVAEVDPSWDSWEMSAKVLEHIIDYYKIGISKTVVKAARKFICGIPYKKWPVWLSQIVRNRETDIDIDKCDYLCRDMNRTINSTRFEYDRLIVNCRVTEDRLSWKLSEIPTLERFFFNDNDMNMRVYKHRVVESIVSMLTDLFSLINESGELDFEEILHDPREFCKIDDRLIYRAELGQFGEAARKLALDIRTRRLYKLVGELRIRPGDTEGATYSQRVPSMIEDDIAGSGERCDPAILRGVSMQFRYGLGSDSHPMLSVPFWNQECNKVIRLAKEDISCIVPNHFNETTVRVYVTDPSQLAVAQKAFTAWKDSRGTPVE